MAGNSAPAHVGRRLGVFIDQAFVYETARESFASSERPSAHFGNVDPARIAREVRHRPPPWEPRSARQVVQVTAVVPQFDPAQRPAMRDRVRRWHKENVDVRFSPSLPGPGWRTARAVLMTMLVTRALDQGQCDVAVIVAGDPGLVPLVTDLVGEDRAGSRVELVTWVSDRGDTSNRLAALVPAAWCHRLGRSTFELLAERPATAAAKRRPSARPVETTMSRAFEATEHRQQAARDRSQPGVQAEGTVGDEMSQKPLRWWRRWRRPSREG